MPEVELSAGMIDYEDTRGTGSAVVLLHGVVMDGTLWRKVVADLRPDYRCVVPTLPLGAHRRPMRWDADLSLRGQALLVAEFLERLDLRDVTIVCNDWGGALLLMSEGRDERIGRLVLAACETFDNMPPGLPGRNLALLGSIPGGLALAAQALRLRPLRRLPLTLGWMSKRAVPSEVVDGWLLPLQTQREIRRDLRKYVSGVKQARAELLAATERLSAFDRPVLVAWAISVVVLIQEKELGASLLFFAIFVVMLWVATARPIYPLSALVLFSGGAYVAYNLFGYVRARFQVWLDPFKTPQGHGYQIVQSLFALATGGVFGTGLGLGKPDLIPEVSTDFIFSAAGEELGLVGTTAILTSYALFGARVFGLATRCRDDFSKLLVTGLGTVFCLQTLLIIGGVTRLIPLTGVTLPFMSYGGSSLLANFVMIALLLRVSDDLAAQNQAAGWTPGSEPLVEVGPAGGGR